MKKFLTVILAVFLVLTMMLPLFTSCDDPSNVHIVKTENNESSTGERNVWIPTRGGTKYHSESSCSNMIDPERVPLSTAQNRGFTACGKCY